MYKKEEGINNLNYEPVSTANARMKLAEPQNFFEGYPNLTFEFFKILLERMPDTTMPIDFFMRFEESLEDVKAEPKRFGHVGIFISTMRLNADKIATILFNQAFGEAVQEVYNDAKAQEKS